MPREGTRSATGNSKPRVFQTVDTAPAIKRTTKSRVKKSPTASTKPGPKVKAAKPTGVTKKKSTAPKKDGVATKVKAAVKKAEEKVEKVEEKVKKTVAKPKTAAK
ncbi:uncharacterized protein F4817DRAFT_34243 [Daldinia loculata]|uniref:uncharacterized protein n=1 Tax=Daldinia childiae TaxID=326645 RepID=UPI001447561C|nr:uncharacterized protein GL218_08415 [Daldinia childiae]XP_049161069.1 uncharacterized protein F4817DRAFT_34243 [Daldinia loculata]KAF3068453.1 hypothetical protein GL218_08415 [Daldinia childiae]KAI1649335.1 hypothetical protein F4817DRAFT_34243 [Daldinia loculata]